MTTTKPEVQPQKLGSITQAWIKQVFDESGAECPNCESWRRLVDGYFIEKCPNCGEDETYIFEVGEAL